MKADLITLQALVIAGGLLIVWFVFRMKFWSRITKRSGDQAQENNAPVEKPSAIDPGL